jgi:hypothetical protein
MSPKFHAAQGAISAAVLYPLIGSDAIVFGLTVFLIDLDHIIPFVRDCKSLSLRKFFQYHSMTPHIPDYLSLAWFHTLEFFLLLLLLGLKWHVFWVMLAACLFHIIFDVVKAFTLGKPHLRAFSFVEYFIRRKGKVTRHSV